MPTSIQPTNIHHPDIKPLVWVSKRMWIQPELLHTQRHPRTSSRDQEVSWKKYHYPNINCDKG